MSLFKNKNAFTLMELITVVIIISIIAAFAIPNYQNSVARAHEKDIISNIRAIVSAQEIYRAENDAYWPAVGWGFTSAINSNLRLGIIENQTFYACFTFAGVDTICLANYAPGAWQIGARSSNNWQLYCHAGTCPTCTPGGCPN